MNSVSNNQGGVGLTRPLESGTTIGRPVVELVGDVFMMSKRNKGVQLVLNEKGG